MFTKLKSLTVPPTGELCSIEQLVDLIRNNPDPKIKHLRLAEYGSKEYKSLKTNLPAVMPHGEFTSLGNSGILRPSEYLFFDIDNLGSEINNVKENLINSFPVSLVCLSPGGNGLHILVKWDGTCILQDGTILKWDGDKHKWEETYDLVFKFIRNQLTNLGFNIDDYAGGLCRKMNISSDINVYYNKDNEFKLREYKVPFRVYNKEEKRSIPGMVPCDDSKSVIPLKILLKTIKLELEYDKEIIGDWIIQDYETYFIRYPKKIIDGKKHSTYNRIVNALYYVNNGCINKNQVYSYIYWINKAQENSMDIMELKRFIYNICNKIEETGIINLKTRKRKMAFNKNSKLGPKEKISISNKIKGHIKTNNKVKIIQDAILRLSEDNIPPTQKNVSELTKIPLSTVKKNWNKKIVDLSLLDSNGEYLHHKQIKFKFKGIYEVDSVFTDLDKSEFLEFIKTIEYPYEDIVINSDVLTNKDNQKEKLWFMYSKWTNKNVIIYDGQVE